MANLCQTCDIKRLLFNIYYKYWNINKPDVIIFDFLITSELISSVYFFKGISLRVGESIRAIMGSFPYLGNKELSSVRFIMVMGGGGCKRMLLSHYKYGTSKTVIWFYYRRDFHLYKYTPLTNSDLRITAVFS